MLDNINLLNFGKKEVDRNVYLMMSDINQQSCADAIQWILSHNFATEDENGEEYKRPECLTLIISSQGGDLYDANALISVMRGSAIPVSTIGIGMIASAGLLIFMAGHRGLRILDENCFCMSHSFSSGIAGTKHDLFGAQKHFAQIQKTMVRMYKKFTDLEESVIEQKLLPPTDVWLEPTEMVELGMADHVQNMK